MGSDPISRSQAVTADTGNFVGALRSLQCKYHSVRRVTRVVKGPREAVKVPVTCRLRTDWVSLSSRLEQRYR